MVGSLDIAAARTATPGRGSAKLSGAASTAVAMVRRVWAPEIVLRHVLITLR